MTDEKLPRWAWVWNRSTLHVERREVWFGYSDLAWVEGFSDARLPRSRIHDTKSEAQREGRRWLTGQIEVLTQALKTLEADHDQPR